MTVAQLIKKLKTLPHDAIVIVRGYEEGVNEADSVTECYIDCFDEQFYDEIGKLPYYYGTYKIAKGSGKKAVYIHSIRDNLKA